MLEAAVWAILNDVTVTFHCLRAVRGTGDPLPSFKKVDERERESPLGTEPI